MTARWAVGLTALLLCTAARAQAWAEAGSVTVETRTNDNRAVKVERHRRNDERMLLFTSKAGSLRLLTMPPETVLLGGFPASTTCEGTSDAPAYFESFFALPLHYLAKAIPQGPQGLESGGVTKRDFTVPAGRVMIGPGNYAEIPRPLKVVVEAERQANGVIRYRIFERGVTDPQNKARRYSGTWSSALATQLPEDRTPLQEWLACARGKPVTGVTTIGELRALRAKRRP
jgi:hypothetical protein